MSGVKSFQEFVGEVKAGIKEVDAPTVKQKLERGDDFVLVDVREQDESRASRLPKAVAIGRGVLEMEIGEHAPGPDKEIVLYCGGGNRSALAAESLQRMGYTNVYSMSGGFRGWRGAGYPLES